MSFRTVVVKSRCKLEYSLNYLIYRNSEEEKRILISEISTLIIQSTQVSITTSLLSNLAENNIKVIFCDAKANPVSELISYQGSYDAYKKLKTQIDYSDLNKERIWARIIKEKIINQAKNLKLKQKREAEALFDYANNVENGDVTNREGHAAKVYFNSLFGKDFYREKICNENTYLDYGYTIILSAFNRVIKSLGYYTELGIHHKGVTNYWNLSCDLMEPLRPLVDLRVINNSLNIENFKDEFIDLLNLKVIIADNEMYLENAIKLYVQSVFNALETGDESKIKFINYEL